MRAADYAWRSNLLATRTFCYQQQKNLHVTPQVLVRVECGRAEQVDRARLARQLVHVDHIVCERQHAARHRWRIVDGYFVSSIDEKLAKSVQQNRITALAGDDQHCIGVYLVP